MTKDEREKWNKFLKEKDIRDKLFDGFHYHFTETEMGKKYYKIITGQTYLNEEVNSAKRWGNYVSLEECRVAVAECKWLEESRAQKKGDKKDEHLPSIAL